MVKVILLFFALVCTNSWSSEPDKPKTDSGKRQTNYEQSYAEKSPIFIYGEVTAKKDEKEAREDANERDFKVKIDQALVNYTKWLAIFTSLLFAATAALCWFTFKLSRDAKNASDRQSSEMQKVLAISQESADAAKKSAEIAGCALTDVERPYIFVSDVSWDWITNDRTRVMCTVANYGKLPGIIQDVRAIISITSDGTPEIPKRVDDSNALLVDPIIAAGEARQNICFVCSESVVPRSFFENQGNEALFFWVIISYRGPFTKEHESSFCWRLSFDMKSYMTFIPFAHDDNNYTK